MMMKNRRRILLSLGPIGIWLLIMTAAQPAAGAGTTGFTCVPAEGGAGFSGAHCRPDQAVATGAKFKHVAIPIGTSTEARVVSEGNVALKSTHAGVKLGLRATGAEDVGVMENQEIAGEHVVGGTGTTTYTGVTVTEPAGKGCKVPGEKIVTKELRATTAGQGMFGKLTPASGTVFAEFAIEGCSVSALNTTYKVEGSIKCPVLGATVICTHTEVTEQGTLTLAGLPAAVEVSTTFSSRPSSISGFTPLSVTT
jgi:hypothetical protein